MKRRLLILAIFLLLGAVVNVAVAWACAAWINIIEFPSARAPVKIGYVCSAAGPRCWQVSVIDGLGAARYMSLAGHPPASSEHLAGRRDMPVRSRGVPRWSGTYDAERWIEIEQYEPEKGGIAVDILIEDARGFPLRSLWCEHVVGLAFGSADPFPIVEVRGGIPVHLNESLARYTSKALPLRPIWPASVMNTLFYATILWLLLLGPFALRRFLRVRRGLCPKCAYPMGESTVCTECGRLLPKRVTT